MMFLKALLEGCSFYFQEKSCRASFEKPDCRRGEAPESFKKELRNYFEGKSEDFKQGAVFLEGTDFEKKVWLALKEIPYGETDV